MNLPINNSFAFPDVENLTENANSLQLNHLSKEFEDKLDMDKYKKRFMKWLDRQDRSNRRANVQETYPNGS